MNTFHNAYINERGNNIPCDRCEKHFHQDVTYCSQVIDSFETIEKEVYLLIENDNKDLAIYLNNKKVYAIITPEQAVYYMKQLVVMFANI